MILRSCATAQSEDGMYVKSWLGRRSDALRWELAIWSCFALAQMRRQLGRAEAPLSPRVRVHSPASWNHLITDVHRWSTYELELGSDRDTSSAACRVNLGRAEEYAWMYPRALRKNGQVTLEVLTETSSVMEKLTGDPGGIQ